jgi:hypothetical protein
MKNPAFSTIISGRLIVDRPTLAAWLRATRESVRNWTDRQFGLPCYSIGKNTRLYDVAEVLHWLCQQKQSAHPTARRRSPSRSGSGQARRLAKKSRSGTAALVFSLEIITHHANIWRFYNIYV